MTPDEITADDILEEFNRSTHAQRRSDAAKQRLKGHDTAEWLMSMNALGGATAVEIIARVLGWCVAQDERLTLGDVLEQDTDAIQVGGSDLTIGGLRAILSDESEG